MALLIKFAQFISRLNDALNEALEARRAARVRHPHISEE